jgi:hypothetical protein
MSNGFKWEDEEFQISPDPLSEGSPKEPEVPIREKPAGPPSEPDVQRPVSSSSVAAAADAAQTIQSALTFLNQTFGKNWAEKAAQQFRQSSRLKTEIEDLKTSLAEANQQFKQKDKEYRVVRAEKAEMARLKEELELRLQQVDQERSYWQQGMQQAESTARQELFSGLEETFGPSSELYKFIGSLQPDLGARVGYACIFSLPKSGMPGQPEINAAPSLPVISALANKFLENVRNIDGPERYRLLTLVADHLSGINRSMYAFANEEGQLFHPDRHALKAGETAPPGSKIFKIASFLVFNNKTRQIIQKAEVTIQSGGDQ